MLLLHIVAATLLVGIISLTGVVLLVRRNDIHRLTIFFISLASGSLLGGAFMHLIPESLEKKGPGALPIIGLGVFIFFVLEKFLIWRHCHVHQEHEHFERATAARMVILSDAAHNFLDGAIIATSFSAGVPVGVSTTVAIILHEIPQELGDFAILVHGGFPVKRALLLNAASAAFALVGAVLTYFFLDLAPAANAVLLPITGGGFLYVALADLIPQLHERSTLRQAAVQILLVAAGFLSIGFLGHHH
jgi:zinc and cadmium transporter